MKVFQINVVCGIGSTGRIAVDLYKVLEQQGHKCRIAYGRGKAPEGIDSFRIGSDLDNYFHVAKTRIFDKHGFGSRKATKELIKQIKEYNPDIIHLQNIHGYYLNVEILFNYLREANKPIIWTLHDCWAFTGHCSYFDYANCSKWKTACYECPQKKEYPASFFLDNSKMNYQKKKQIFTSVKNLTFVTPSSWLAKLVKESYLGNYPVKVINNGIDLDVFKPTESDFRVKHNLQDKFIILGVANIWDRRKGLDTFIEISKKLDDNFKIIVVGVTEKQKEKLPKNIVGITRTNNVKELTEIYTAADVFVNPTLEDNFPTTNIEALASGTPVITYETGGSPESIDERCGMIVKKGCIDKLAEAIEKCRKNNFNRNACTERAQLYEKSLRFKEYVEYYKYLLKIRE